MTNTAKLNNTVSEALRDALTENLPHGQPRHITQVKTPAALISKLFDIAYAEKKLLDPDITGWDGEENALEIFELAVKQLRYNQPSYDGLSLQKEDIDYVRRENQGHKHPIDSDLEKPLDFTDDTEKYISLLKFLTPFNLGGPAMNPHMSEDPEVSFAVLHSLRENDLISEDEELLLQEAVRSDVTAQPFEKKTIRNHYETEDHLFHPDSPMAKEELSITAMDSTTRSSAIQHNQTQQDHLAKAMKTLKREATKTTKPTSPKLSP